MEGNFIWHTLLILFSTIHFAVAAGRVINIFDHQEGDDIVELRRGNGKMFNALHRDSSDKWPKSDDGNVYIPYMFSKYSDYNNEELQNFSIAVDRINSNTCIRFVPWNGETDYIEVVNNPGERCYTSVGRARGKEVLQLESSPSATCMTLNTLIHELMHITGLWHEHMRYDRDRYIKVHYENIDPGLWNQFEKLTFLNGTTYNVPYDYTSIMHYGKTAFSKDDRQITMETWNPLYQDIIGTQEDASPNDYKKICEIYECSECKGATMDNGKPIVEPKPFGKEQVNDLECRDKYPFICKQMEENNFIDCMHGRDVKMCCATCQVWAERHGLNRNWFY